MKTKHTSGQANRPERNTMKKIRVYINDEYKFTTTRYKTIKELKQYLRAVKHIEIASIPVNEYVTIYDYDKIHCEYVRV